MYLHSLLYTSTATASFNNNELESLVTLCNKHNELNGISGAIIFHNAFFIQALEGDLFKLNTLYTKLLVDKRHKDLTLRSFGPIEERRFKEWGMAHLCLFDFYDSLGVSASTKISISAHGSINPNLMSCDELHSLMLYSK